MKIFLQILGGVLLAVGILPLIKNDYWIFRVFEFPRVQKLIIALLVVVAYFTFYFEGYWQDWALVALLLVLIIHLLLQILPFTPLSKKQLIKTGILNSDRTISLAMWNVYQYNPEYKRAVSLFKRVDSDILLLLETDSIWQKNLKPIEKIYPYLVHVPLENTYGMLFYSKLPIVNERVEYLVEEGIPSIHVQLKLRSGEPIQLYCIHPTPPVPQENPRATERDKELLMIANKAKKSKMPVIVCGDLNDVAWSYTTTLFQNMSGLLDPRRGRGFFNTFHAKIPFLRFPLDHVFCSIDFTLVKMNRLQNYGSDHFPMYIKLQYEPRATLLHNEPEATVEDKELAQEKIEKETRDDGPAPV